MNTEWIKLGINRGGAWIEKYKAIHFEDENEFRSFIKESEELFPENEFIYLDDRQLIQCWKKN